MLQEKLSLQEDVCSCEQVYAQTEIQARKFLKYCTSSTHRIGRYFLIIHKHTAQCIAIPLPDTLFFFPFPDICFEVCNPKSKLFPAPPIHVARHYKSTPRFLAFCHFVSSTLTYLFLLAACSFRHCDSTSSLRKPFSLSTGPSLTREFLFGTFWSCHKLL